MDMQRKAQATVFMVLAVIIVVLGTFYYIQIDRRAQGGRAPVIPSQTQDFVDGQVFLQSCLDESAQIVVDDLAESGSLLSKKTLIIGNIPRAVFSSPGEVPTLDEALQSMQTSFGIQLDECLMDMEFPYKLMAEDARVEVEYSNGKIYFRTYPITAKSEAMSRTYDTFVNQVAYPLDEYLRNARAGMEAMTLKPGSINMSTFMSMSAYYTIRQGEDGVVDITLSSDQSSGTSYSFIAQVRQ